MQRKGVAVNILRISVLFIFVFSLMVVSVQAGVLTIDSPVNDTQYSTPIIPLTFSYSTSDLGIVQYSLNGVSNLSLNYTIGSATIFQSFSTGGSESSNCFYRKFDWSLCK
tara:strand:- start:4 stop:333 length:330 start_codon:yes stop_codon:yes gene_type:complete